MASSKDKATALKDNYVAGLIEAGATAPAPTMPEQDMGNTAGMVMDLRNGINYGQNDGNPSLVVTDGNSKVKIPHSKMAFPNIGGGYGSMSGGPMNQETADYAAGILYNPAFSSLRKPTSPRSTTAGDMYNHYMR